MLPVKKTETVGIDIPVRALRQLQVLVNQLLEVHAGQMPASVAGGGQLPEQSQVEPGRLRKSRGFAAELSQVEDEAVRSGQVLSPQSEWAEIEANARACREARRKAVAKERQAYQKVLAFVQPPDMRVRALVPADFLEKVKRAVKLQSYRDAADAQYKADEEADKTRKELMALQLQKLQELEAERQRTEAPRPTQGEPLPPRGPGPTALEYKDATKPCDKWDEPRKDLLYKRYCWVCNLKMVARTDNCPNYFQHDKFRQGREPRYEYPDAPKPAFGPRGRN